MIELVNTQDIHSHSLLPHTVIPSFRNMADCFKKWSHSSLSLPLPQSPLHRVLPVSLMMRWNLSAPLGSMLDVVGS